MWREMARIIHEVQPRFAFVENSPMLTSRGLGTVLGDLAAMGFDARWGVLGAADVGANHQRDRIWIKATNVSNPSEIRRSWEHGIQADRCSASINGKRYAENAEESTNVGEVQELAQPKNTGLERWKDRGNIKSSESRLGQSSWPIQDNWLTEPNVGRVADGVAARVDRLKAIGNGQVPLCAATAWRLLA